jgi:hypothetical protein
LLIHLRKGDELVTFLIGKDQRKYLVHKSFACYYSPVLNAAFTGSFIEGQTQTYILEDTNPDGFERFVNWLYTQKIEAYKEGENVGIFFKITAQLYVLAQKFLIPRFKIALWMRSKTQDPFLATSQPFKLFMPGRAHQAKALFVGCCSITAPTISEPQDIGRYQNISRKTCSSI